MPLARLVSLIAAALVLGYLAWHILRQGTSLPALVALAAAGFWLTLELVRRLLRGVPDPALNRVSAGTKNKRGKAGSTEKESSLVSLVLLLDEAREPTEASVRRCVSDALGIKLNPRDPKATSFVLEMPTPTGGPARGREIGHFMIKIPQGVFMFLNSNAPYIDDPRAFARESIRDQRLRSAFEKHQAWIAVDLMGEPDQAEERHAAYATIGKLLSMMAGPDCLAIYSPERHACIEFDPSLLPLLRTGDPLAIFDAPTHDPLIEISASRPGLKAAMETARERWPEFVRAFASADLSDEATVNTNTVLESAIEDEDAGFLVKAVFRHDDVSEHMWVRPMRADDAGLSGILVSDPHGLTQHHRGQSVTVTRERISDWIYPLPEGGVAGGFTLEIIREAAGDFGAESD